MYVTLACSCRPDVELELKCFHHEDRTRSTNWPNSVSVSVNDVPLLIDRGNEHKATHQPLYLKNIIHNGNNSLVITVSACCCVSGSSIPCSQSQFTRASTVLVFCSHISSSCNSYTDPASSRSSTD